jgi:hypothetical protein
MKLMNYTKTRELLTQLFKQDQLAASVAEVLEKQKWDIGQPTGLTEFLTWLNPVIAGGCEVVTSGAAKSILALSIHYYTRRHPNANRRNIRSASHLVYAAVSGDATSLKPLENAVEGYCWELLAACAVDDDSSELQTRIIFRLIEAVVFSGAGLRQKTERQPLLEAGKLAKTPTVPLTEEGKRETLLEAIALLEATKESFKSKLVFQAKKKLETLL